MTIGEGVGIGVEVGVEGAGVLVGDRVGSAMLVGVGVLVKAGVGVDVQVGEEVSAGVCWEIAEGVDVITGVESGVGLHTLYTPIISKTEPSRTRIIRPGVSSGPITTSFFIGS